MQRVECRVHLPKDAEPLAGGHIRPPRLRSDSACAAGNIFIDVGGAHTEGRIGARTLRGQEARSICGAVSLLRWLALRVDVGAICVVNLT